MDALTPSARDKRPKGARPHSSRRGEKIEQEAITRAPSSTTEIAAIIDTAARTGILEPAVTAMRLALSAPDPLDAAWAALAVRLLTLVAERLPVTPPLSAVPRRQVPIDDRLASSFEKLTALIRQQDAQMAELHSIIADLL